MATIEGIRAIKTEIPGVQTSLGVSNVSFGVGLPARSVLNSVFLHHCVEAGLDLAMVNPNHITPYAEIPDEERELADDLVFDRRDDALERFIAHFESKGPTAEDGAGKADPTEGMEPEEALHFHILRRKKEGVEDWIDASVEKIGAVPTLNDVLLPAMKEVGDKFGAGELILPFVLQSAEVMKRAVARLEQYLDKLEGYTKGTVVLATVFGDVHDIGKSLVNTILTNNGYSVVDLGKQVPIGTILDAAVEHKATAIGLSALLVSTSKQMPAAVQELHERKLDFPVLIGGAAINRNFGLRILYPHGTESDDVYQPGIFYCKDAFEGLAKMDQLIDPARRDELVTQTRAAAQKLRDTPVDTDTDAPDVNDASVRSAAATDTPVPEPPYWGARELDVPMDEYFLAALLRARGSRDRDRRARPRRATPTSSARCSTGPSSSPAPSSSGCWPGSSFPSTVATTVRARVLLLPPRRRPRRRHVPPRAAVDAADRDRAAPRSADARSARLPLAIAVATGVVLGLGQLVRAFSLWTFAAVMLAFLVARAWRPLVLVVVATVVVASPWYVRQAIRYGNPVFDRPTKSQPLWERRPARFYVGLGLPKSLTDPVRPHFRNEALPTTYSEVWGDYFGVWRGNRERQSFIGLLPTLLALAGWLLLLIRWRRCARAAAGRAAAWPRHPRLPLLHRQLSDVRRRRAQGQLHAHDGARVGTGVRIRGRTAAPGASVWSRPRCSPPRRSRAFRSCCTDRRDDRPLHVCGTARRHRRRLSPCGCENGRDRRQSAGACALSRRRARARSRASTTPSTCPCFGRLVDEYEARLVVPLTDLDQLTLARRRDELDALVLLPGADIVERLEDKYLAHVLFEERGIASPPTWLPRDLPDDAPFPLLVKARHGFGSRHIYRADDRGQLEFFLGYTPVESIVQVCLGGRSSRSTSSATSTGAVSTRSRAR